MENRMIHLLADAIYKKEDISTLYKDYIKGIKSIGPDEVFIAMTEFLKQGKSPDEVLSIVDKVINVLYKKLSEYHWDIPERNTFIYFLMEENKALIKILEKFKPLMKKQDLSIIKKETGKLINSLEEYNVHLSKLENILFPVLEKKHDMFDGLSIMWALHGEARALLKQSNSVLLENDVDIIIINKLIGKLFFKYFGLVQKQDLLLFPAALKWISTDELLRMQSESYEIGFAFIESPKKPNTLSDQKGIIASGKFESQTGALNIKQLTSVLNNLPLDITVIDEEDRVVYFSDNKERIFLRTPSVIGRKVQNCHPPKSLAMVEEILSKFKENKKDSETFWINMNKKTILIKYTALRDHKGNYLGTFESTQDITEIKKLVGEKRLIDEEK